MEELSSTMQHPLAYPVAGGQHFLRRLKHTLNAACASHAQLQIAITLSEAGDVEGARDELGKHSAQE